MALVVLAALFWGLSGAIGGVLMAAGWDAFVVSFFRGAIGLLFVLTWLALRPHASGLASPRLWFWSLVAGVGVAGNFALYFVSIEQGSVAVAATLMYCAPIFVYLVSFSLKIEKPTALKWAAITMALIGIVLLTQVYDVASSGITPLGVGAGLVAGLSYALFIFGFKYAAPHGSPQTILSIAFGVLVAILVWPADMALVVAALSEPEWPLFVALGIFGAGLSFVFYVIGLNHVAPAVVSIVAMVEPVSASLFGLVFLDERLVGVQLLGMGLILVTVSTLGASSGRRSLYAVKARLRLRRRRRRAGIRS